MLTIDHVVGHDQMVLGVDGDLHIVADGRGAFAAGRHRTVVGIGAYSGRSRPPLPE